MKLRTPKYRVSVIKQIWLVASEQLIKVFQVKELHEGLQTSEGENLQSNGRKKIVRLLQWIIDQLPETMLGWCFLSTLIKIEILIMQ